MGKLKIKDIQADQKRKLSQEETPERDLPNMVGKKIPEPIDKKKVKKYDHWFFRIIESIFG